MQKGENVMADKNNFNCAVASIHTLS